MRMKKMFGMLLACAIAVNCVCINAGVAAADAPEADTPATYATGRFSMEVAGNTAETVH